jgi:hypothetical protein
METFFSTKTSFPTRAPHRTSKYRKPVIVYVTLIFTARAIIYDMWIPINISINTGKHNEKKNIEKNEKKNYYRKYHMIIYFLIL